MRIEHPIEWDDTKVSRLWDYYSRTPPYSNLYTSNTYGDRILRETRLPLDQELDVLDFGCGPGFIWDHLRRLDARWTYTGADFSSASVSKAIEKGKGHPRFGGIHRVDSLPTVFSESRFDVLLLLELVEHLRDDYLDATLKEAARVLRRGGKLVITTPNSEDLSLATKFCPECGCIFHEWQHVRTWSIATLTDYVRRYGFHLALIVTLDLSVRGFLRRAARLLRRVLGEKRQEPHMIAVFQKL